MKRLILLTAGTFLSLCPCVPAQGQSNAARANALYRQGLQAMEQGQAETAKACFEGVLQLQPTNANARFQLKQLSLQGDRFAAKRRELKMKAVTLPKVDFEDLTLPEALEAINAVVTKETKGEFTPNFIVEDPESVLADRRFSLKLGSVPASVALKYALDSARAVARYDEHAIVIRPIGRGSGNAEGGDPLLEKLGKPAPKRAPDPFAK